MELNEFKYGLSQIFDNKAKAIITFETYHILLLYENYDRFNKDFSPIKITESILFEAGFEYDHKRRLVLYASDVIVTIIIKEDIDIVIDGKLYRNLPWHRLQDVIHAMTGKIININVSHRSSN